MNAGHSAMTMIHQDIVCFMQLQEYAANQAQAANKACKLQQHCHPRDDEHTAWFAPGSRVNQGRNMRD
jgi:hypothetical protein